MSGYLQAGLLALSIVATGLSVLRLLRVRESSRPMHLGLAVLAGNCALLAALYLPLALFDRVEFRPALLLLALGTAAAIVSALRDRPRLRGLAPSWLTLVLSIAVGVPLCLLDLQPFTGYDAKAIFGLKGKILLYERGVHGPLFQDVDLVHFHSDYPLGIPLQMALSGWVAEGEPQDPTGAEPASSAEEWVARHDAIDAYMLLSLLWIAGIFCMVAGAVRRHGLGPWPSAALIALALPLLQIGHIHSWAGWHSIADGDRPLTLCFGGIGVAFAAWLQGRGRGWLGLSMAAAAGAVLIKNEALIGLACLPCAALFARERPRALGGSLLVLAAALPSVLLVRAVVARTAGSPYDEQYLQALTGQDWAVWLERLTVIPSAVASTLEGNGMDLFWSAFAILALPLAWRRGGAARVVLVWALAYLLGCLAIMVVTPNHVVFHVNTALHRLWAQMAIPAGILLVDAVVGIWSTDAGPASAGVPSAPQRRAS
jgi:hypothetical protein